MNASNAIDMSLDEIIKLNKKARQSRIPIRRKRGIVVKKATALRPSLLKNMKSRQTLAAQAIFKRARQTAAIAAKVAADAAALVSPSYVASNAGAAQKKNRKLMVQRRILPKKRVLIRQRQQQQTRRNQDLRSHLNNLPHRQNQVPNQRQIRPVNARSLNRGSRNNNNRNLPRNQRVLSSAAAGNRQWQSAPQRIIRSNLSRRGQPNRARLNSSRMSSLPPYQQYIEQARALIRAQEEMRNASSPRSINRNGLSQNNARNIFVDVPVRNNEAGGDFRGGSRFVRAGRGAGRFRR
ncbi:unnamed protein product [Hymenolepis diminuta]|uniref:Forty-two-three domain-containing protein 1 n=1 Tax=Hymenolepis diminuta TaxID=6216 RepID=A0A0R3SFP3_HYMDI|nr:unnamed protein product [Hymenolepis diminuta]